MVEITVQVSNSLAERLQPVRDQLPAILEIGLQRSRSLSTRAYEQVIEFLATTRAPAEILAFRYSPSIQTDINRLLNKHKTGALAADEASELDRIGDLEHILIALKARARQQLDQGRAV